MATSSPRASRAGSPPSGARRRLPGGRQLVERVAHVAAARSSRVRTSPSRVAVSQAATGRGGPPPPARRRRPRAVPAGAPAPTQARATAAARSGGRVDAPAAGPPRRRSRARTVDRLSRPETAGPGAARSRHGHPEGPGSLVAWAIVVASAAWRGPARSSSPPRAAAGPRTGATRAPSSGWSSRRRRELVGDSRSSAVPRAAPGRSRPRARPCRRPRACEQVERRGRTAADTDRRPVGPAEPGCPQGVGATGRVLAARGQRGPHQRDRDPVGLPGQVVKGIGESRVVDLDDQRGDAQVVHDDARRPAPSHRRPLHAARRGRGGRAGRTTRQRSAAGPAPARAARRRAGHAGSPGTATGSGTRRRAAGRRSSRERAARGRDRRPGRPVSPSTGQGAARPRCWCGAAPHAGPAAGCPAPPGPGSR